MSFSFSWLCGLETEEDALFFISRVACYTHIHPKTLPFPPWTKSQYYFYWEYPFSIKGITQIALGCEATYISLTPKIPK